MKKIIILNTITIIAVLLLSACGSNSSITKRHYNKGYYFSHSKGKQRVAKLDKERVIYESANVIVKPNSINEINNSLISKGDLPKSSTTSNEFLEKGNLKGTSAHLPSIHDDAPISKLKKEIAKKQSAAASDDDDALSLLWIVIVVLLVLWILGLLGGGFGLGGFINILLLIALILLILWLLKIL